MTDSSRQTVRQSLEKAVEMAMPVFRSRLPALDPDAQPVAARCAEGIVASLRDLAEAPGSSAATQEALTRLIFSHADPKVVQALREFTEVVDFYLREARDGLQPPRERKGS